MTFPPDAAGRSISRVELTMKGVVSRVTGKVIGYMPVPKIASSSNKRYLLYIGGILATPTATIGSIHGTWKQQARVDKPDFSYCIYRDPVARFISGYTWGYYCDRLKPGMDSFIKVDFDGFIKQFEALHADPWIRSHFRRQYTILGEPADYHKTYAISEMDQVRADLSEISGFELPPLSEKKTADFKQQVAEQVRDHHIDWIRAHYAEDYRRGWC